MGGGGDGGEGGWGRVRVGVGGGGRILISQQQGGRASQLYSFQNVEWAVTGWLPFVSVSVSYT